MVKVDDGTLLREIFERAAAGFGTRFEVAAPFFDHEGLLWQNMVRAAGGGPRVRLFTRWPEEQDKQAALTTLAATGMTIAITTRLHAKAALLTDATRSLWYGWVGSHNLTLSSERTSMELGVAFSGGGEVECGLMRDLLAAIGIWEKVAGHEARRPGVYQARRRKGSQ